MQATPSAAAGEVRADSEINIADEQNTRQRRLICPQEKKKKPPAEITPLEAFLDTLGKNLFTMPLVGRKQILGDAS